MWARLVAEVVQQQQASCSVSRVQRMTIKHVHIYVCRITSQYAARERAKTAKPRGLQYRDGDCVLVLAAAAMHDHAPGCHHIKESLTLGAYNVLPGRCLPRTSLCCTANSEPVRYWLRMLVKRAHTSRHQVAIFISALHTLYVTGACTLNCTIKTS